MRYKPLGKSGIEVSEVCLGTMTFGNETDEKTANEITSRFIDIGGNFIDTANAYGGPLGMTEDILGRILKGKREDIILATKVGFGTAPNNQGLSRRHILESVDNSLTRLQTDHVEILYLHVYDHVTPFEETLSALETLVRSGKVLYVGVSNFAAWHIMKFLSISDLNGWVRFIAYQPQYNLLVREIEKEFVPLCLKEGIGIVPWAPIAGGFLSGKYKSKDIKPESGRLAKKPREDTDSWENRGTVRNFNILKTVEDIAEKRHVSCPQVALNWIKKQPAMAAPIVGVRTLQQYDDNIKCIEWELTEEEVRELNRASDTEKPYPYDFIGKLQRR